MSKKKEDSNVIGAFLNTAAVVARRMAASKAVSSGTLEEHREEQVKLGDAPWRIIRYERCLDPNDFPLLLPLGSFIRPKTLEKHLEYLKENCQPISLMELLRLLEQNEEIPEKAVVVTFDNGHMDNFANAVPLLLKHKIPASFYVSTAYIGKGNFFLEDRIALGLLVFRELQLPLPEISLFDKESQELIKGCAPEQEINIESIAAFVTAFRRLDHPERMAVLELLARIMDNVASLPQFDDFMGWEELQRLAELGFGVGTMGHGHFLSMELDEKSFIEDYSMAFQLLSENKLEMEPPFCFREGVIAATSRELLNSVKLRYALTLDHEAQPKYQTELPMFLGRIAMNEENAFSTDIFACRLWGLELKKQESADD